MKVIIEGPRITYYTEAENYAEVVTKFIESENNKSEFIVLNDLIVKKEEITAIFIDQE